MKIRVNLMGDYTPMAETYLTSTDMGLSLSGEKKGA